MTTGSAISLFSGAGGLDLRVEAAGSSTLAAVEWNAEELVTKRSLRAEGVGVFRADQGTSLRWMDERYGRRGPW